MEKIVRCRICPEDAGLTVEKAALPRLGLTRHQLRSAKFRADGIRLNGVRVRTSVMVAPGDLLEICLEADMPVGDSANAAASTVGPAVSAAAPASSAFPLLSILYEDEDLLILDKPAGMVSHPGRGHRGDSLTDLVLAYFRAQGKVTLPRLVGRLDKDTSGCILFAKNAAAAQRLSRPGMVQKEYLALAQGIIPEEELIFSAPIRRVPGQLNKMETVPAAAAGTCGGSGQEAVSAADFSSAREALTFCQVLARSPEAGITLVRLRLGTGRTHQIRVHLAGAGFPLLGDPLYGGDASPAHGPGIFSAPSAKLSAQHVPEMRPDTGSFLPAPGRAALHCAVLSLRQPFTGEQISITAKLPGDIRTILADCGIEFPASVPYTYFD